MYTLVIADDEEELREALVTTVDWNRIGFQVVGEAENGVEALELIEQLNPDLLLTDIKMPFLSGIELARNAREVSPALNIAFLSGFDDFEYAKQAIQYNIISYILKPISAEELMKEMVQIREKMDKRIADLKQYRSPEDFDKLKEEYDRKLFFFSLLTGENPGLSDRAVTCGLRRDEKETTSYLIQTISLYDAEGRDVTKESYTALADSIICKYARCISIYSNNQIVTIAAELPRELKKFMTLFPREICQTAKKIFGYQAQIGISNLYEELEKTHVAYLEAVDAHDYIARGKDGVAYISDFERKMTQTQIQMRAVDRVEELVRILKTEDAGQVSDYIDKIYQDGEMGRGLVASELVVAIYETLKSFAGEDEAEILVGEVFHQDERMNRMIDKKSKEEIKDFAMRARTLIAAKRKSAKDAICDEVERIIDAEYGDETLSLTVISERLHLTSSYLSAIIKKGFGENFITLLTNKRMQVAKDAILYSSKKILEIALECGFSDNHYFSYSFKKYYGVSPKKMRADLHASDT